MLTDEESKEFYKLMRRVGLNLRKVRRERKTTQAEMSTVIGVSYKYYQSIENGDQPLSMRGLFRIARRSNVSIMELVR
jgi:transcriptional regulator with XRE-family HTH domain